MLCCNTESKLVRSNHLYGDIVVENAEAHVCPTCNKVLGWPHNSSGRIALARHKQETGYDRVRYFPVPIELTDRVVGLNAVLGTLANPEHYFQLAFHLGMQLSSSSRMDDDLPPSSWKMLDDLPLNDNCAIFITDNMKTSLKERANHWDATEGNVFRWVALGACHRYM
ncbi:hypothetical protein UFOVP75_229 [uncultured Caudovirales phage]|uniref:Uncharacterized protein n=1 Tax=uncultured Caudovirales phage TaxID=2100421 RepID=A0A6J5L2R7_9CAUD|nr:hypothetical protein UFOVP75_229 [uncultured Caudovirales phage]